jgi:hypothetical protein
MFTSGTRGYNDPHKLTERYGIELSFVSAGMGFIATASFPGIELEEST